MKRDLITLIALIAFFNVFSQTTFNQGIKIEDGRNLNFQGYSTRPEDAGDIVFAKNNDEEIARIRSEFDGTGNNRASIIFSTASIIDNFKFSGGGNLGIGTMNPQAGLEIYKSYNINTTKAIKLFYLGSWGTPEYASNFRFIDISSTEEGNIFQLNAYGMGIGYNPPSYASKDKLYINGNVGIGTTSPTNKLDVNGTIHSKEVKVDMEGWSDFVFRKEYKLPTLEEVEKQIAQKGHLENIPNEEEVLKNGINLGEMNAKLLQKIEELMLYTIQQNKQINVQSKEIETLKDLVLRVSRIENELARK